MYEHNKMADLSLSMNSQAWAVLHALSNMEPDFAEYNKEFHAYEFTSCTYAWYNGRERGFSLVIQPPDKWRIRDYLVIAVAEGRNHDGIVIDHWIAEKTPWNGPVVSDLPDESYHNRPSIGYLRVDKAVDHIMAICRAQWKVWKKEAAAKAA